MSLCVGRAYNRGHSTGAPVRVWEWWQGAWHHSSTWLTVGVSLCLKRFYKLPKLVSRVIQIGFTVYAWTIIADFWLSALDSGLSG